MKFIFGRLSVVVVCDIMENGGRGGQVSVPPSIELAVHLVDGMAG